MEFNKIQMEVIEELKRNIYLTAPAGTVIFTKYILYI